jgi:hypothetical protein
MDHYHHQILIECEALIEAARDICDDSCRLRTIAQATVAHSKALMLKIDEQHLALKKAATHP